MHREQVNTELAKLKQVTLWPPAESRTPTELLSGSHMTHPPQGTVSYCLSLCFNTLLVYSKSKRDFWQNVTECYPWASARLAFAIFFYFIFFFFCFLSFWLGKTKKMRMRKVATTRKAFDLIMGIKLQDVHLLFSYGVDAKKKWFGASTSRAALLIGKKRFAACEHSTWWQHEPFNNMKFVYIDKYFETKQTKTLFLLFCQHSIKT